VADVDVEDEIARASALLDENRIAEAAVAYAKCEELLAREKSPRRAEVLTNLARIARARVGPKEAAGLLDFALAIFPAHRGAVAERLYIARELEDHASAAMLGLRSFNFAEDDRQRLAVLEGVVRDALEAAASAIRAALQIRRGDRSLFERMRALHEAAGEYARAVDVAVSIAETIADPIERARAFVSAADLCAERAGNVDRAVALYEAAIADDPAVPGAFEAIEQVLLDSGDVVGTERAYVRQLERLHDRSEEARVKLLHKLAAIREDRLADWQGAAEALDQLVKLRPRDADARIHLARLLEEHGQDALAVRCLEIAAVAVPKHAPTFRALHRVSTKRGDLDRAFTAASVLVHHEEADPDEQALYRTHAPRLALSPQRAVDDAALAMLAPDDHDPVVAAIVSSISDAAVAMRLDQLKAAKQLPKLDGKQDLEKSTVSAVRTVGWASRFFAIKPPAVYVRTGEPFAFAQLPAYDVSLGLGDAVLTGRSIPELAFLLGYEFATFRNYGRVLSFFPQVNDLKALVAAGIGSALGSDQSDLSRAIATRLDAVQRLKLQTAVRALSERGGQLDILRFHRAVERMACRAGLLACGDVNVAARLIAIDGRTIGGLTAADRVRDLVAFSVSEPYARLRAALGVAIGMPRFSERPPPAS
jgi:tetratricopeptide (TPR) repeat protein